MFGRFNIYTSHHRRYSPFQKLEYLEKSCIDSLISINDTISTCKSTWFNEDHLGYERLLSELKLWHQGFEKVKENSLKSKNEEKDAIMNEENKKKEAWLAMLKKTGQDINTPIGR